MIEVKLDFEALETDLATEDLGEFDLLETFDPVEDFFSGLLG